MIRSVPFSVAFVGRPSLRFWMPSAPLFSRQSSLFQQMPRAELIALWVACEAAFDAVTYALPPFACRRLPCGFILFCPVHPRRHRRFRAARILA
jgi:hypothetical protein